MRRERSSSKSFLYILSVVLFFIVVLTSTSTGESTIIQTDNREEQDERANELSDNEMDNVGEVNEQDRVLGDFSTDEFNIQGFFDKFTTFNSSVKTVEFNWKTASGLVKLEGQRLIIQDRVSEAETTAISFLADYGFRENSLNTVISDGAGSVFAFEDDSYICLIENKSTVLVVSCARK